MGGVGGLRRGLVNGTGGLGGRDVVFMAVVVEVAAVVVPEGFVVAVGTASLVFAARVRGNIGGSSPVALPALAAAPPCSDELVLLGD
jgi:hypothetical protein